MNPVYNLAVHMSFNTAGLAGAAFGAIAVFQQLQHAATQAQGGVTSAMSRMQALFAGGALITGGSLLLIDAMKGGINTAAQWTDAMVQVAMATGASGKALDELRQKAIALSAPRLFSATQVMQVEAQAARLGLNNPAVLERAMPGLLNVAEIGQRSAAHTPVTTSVESAVSLAHLFQLWPTRASQTGAFNQMLNTFARAQLVSGLGPEQMTRALTYLAPAGRNYGINPEDMIAFAALAGRAGLIRSGGGGGSGGGAASMASIFYALSPNGAKHNEAMNEIARLGGTTWGRLAAQQQNFIPNMLLTVMKAMNQIQGPDAGALRLELLTGAFGRTGARALTPLTTEAVAGPGGQYDQIRRLLGHGPGGLPSAQQMQQMINMTPIGQWQTLQTTLQNIGGLLMTQLMPSITSFLHTLNGVVGAIQGFALAHPALTRLAGQFALITAALGLVVGPAMMLIGIIGMMTAAFSGLTVSMLVPGAVILGLIAAVAAIIVVWQNWGTITAAVGTALNHFGQMIGGLVSGGLTLLREGIGWLNEHVPILSQILNLQLLPIELVVKAFTHWHDIVQALQPLWDALQPTIKGAAAIFEGIATAVGHLVTQIGDLISNFEKLATGTAGKILGTIGGWIGGAAGAIGGLRLPGIPTLPFGIGGGSAAAGAYAAPTGAGAGAAEMHAHTHHVYAGAVVNHFHMAPGASADEIGRAAMRHAATALHRAAAHETHYGSVRPRGARPHLRVAVPL